MYAPVAQDTSLLGLDLCLDYVTGSVLQALKRWEVVDHDVLWHKNAQRFHAKLSEPFVSNCPEELLRSQIALMHSTPRAGKTTD